MLYVLIAITCLLPAIVLGVKLIGRGLGILCLLFVITVPAQAQSWDTLTNRIQQEAVEVREGFKVLERGPMMAYVSGSTVQVTLRKGDLFVELAGSPSRVRRLQVGTRITIDPDQDTVRDLLASVIGGTR